MLNIRILYFALTVPMLIITTASYADVIELEDKFAWESAVGDFTTIDFTGFPEYTVITDQYSDQGVMFTDGDDYIYINEFLFLNDTYGLSGSIDDGPISVEFDHPQYWIAVDYPGVIAFDLYKDNVLFYSSIWFSGHIGDFAGLISTDSFDKVVIHDPLNESVSIDDLYFGGYVPGAGSGVLLLFSSVLWKKRRRT